MEIELCKMEIELCKMAIRLLLVNSVRVNLTQWDCGTSSADRTLTMNV